jgi:hypothetical protein
MKNQLLLALLAVAFAGCSRGSSDPAPVPTTSPLVGTWNQIRYSQTSTPSGGAAVTVNQIVPPGYIAKNYTADGKYEVIQDGKSMGSGTYTYVGKTLTTQFSGLSEVWEVTEITGNRMVQTATYSTGNSTNVDSYTYTR